MSMPDPTQGAGTDPSQGGASTDSGQDDEQSGQPVAIVCIADMGDGTYSVYTESDGDEDDQGQAGEPEDAQTADNLDDALNMAAQMLQQESGEESGESESDDNAPVSNPQAVWNQLAKKSDKSRGVS